MHAYRTVTGVDLTVEPTEPRLQERKLDPAVLLARRLEDQRRIGIPMAEQNPADFLIAPGASAMCLMSQLSA